MTILVFAGIAGSWLIGALDQKIGTKKTMIMFEFTQELMK